MIWNDHEGNFLVQGERTSISQELINDIDNVSQIIEGYDFELINANGKTLENYSRKPFAEGDFEWDNIYDILF